MLGSADDKSTNVLRMTLQIEPAAAERYSFFGSEKHVAAIRLTCAATGETTTSLSVSAVDDGNAIDCQAIDVFVAMSNERFYRLIAQLQQSDKVRVTLSSVVGLYRSDDQEAEVKILIQSAGLPDFLMPAGEEDLPRFQAKDISISFARDVVYTAI